MVLLNCSQLNFNLKGRMLFYYRPSYTLSHHCVALWHVVSFNNLRVYYRPSSDTISHHRVALPHVVSFNNLSHKFFQG